MYDMIHKLKLCLGSKNIRHVNGPLFQKLGKLNSTLHMPFHVDCCRGIFDVARLHLGLNTDNSRPWDFPPLQGLRLTEVDIKLHQEEISNQMLSFSESTPANIISSRGSVSILYPQNSFWTLAFLPGAQFRKQIRSIWRNCKLACASLNSCCMLDVLSATPDASLCNPSLYQWDLQAYLCSFLVQPTLSYLT